MELLRGGYAGEVEAPSCLLSKTGFGRVRFTDQGRDLHQLSICQGRLETRYAGAVAHLPFCSVAPGGAFAPGVRSPSMVGALPRPRTNPSSRVTDKGRRCGASGAWLKSGKPHHWERRFLPRINQRPAVGERTGVPKPAIVYGQLLLMMAASRYSWGDARSLGTLNRFGGLQSRATARQLHPPWYDVSGRPLASQAAGTRRRLGMPPLTFKSFAAAQQRSSDLHGNHAARPVCVAATGDMVGPSGGPRKAKQVAHRPSMAVLVCF
jgi:hypothetical protein